MTLALWIKNDKRALVEHEKNASANKYEKYWIKNVFREDFTDLILITKYVILIKNQLKFNYNMNFICYSSNLIIIYFERKAAILNYM